MEDLKIGVAVIDDGVNEKLYDNGELKHNIEIFSDLTIRERKDYDKYNPSHATTCAAIIRKYSEEALMSSIKILDNDRKTGRKDQLIAAVGWCIENNIKLINLSLGTIDFRDFYDIKECINNAADKGIIIIAACNNRNVFTYPACLSNVIGVRSRKVYSEDQFSINLNSFDGIDVLASGRHKLIDVFGNEIVTSAANSFAAPVITAKVYNIIKRKGNISLEEIKNELYKEAANFLPEAYSPFLKVNTDWIRNAILIHIGAENDKHLNIYSRVLKILRVMSVETEFDGSICIEKIFSAINRETTLLNDVDAVIINIHKDVEIDCGFTSDLCKYCKSLGVNIVVIQNNDINTSINSNGEIDGIRVWHPFYYTNAVQKAAKKECKLDIPIIVIYGYESYDVSYMLYELNSLFRKVGYYSIPVSGVCSDILMEAEYLPDGINMVRYISSIYKKYCCDLILLGSVCSVQNQQCILNIPDSIDTDVGIYIGNKKNPHISNPREIGENSIVCEYAGELNENKVLEIFYEIIKLFNVSNL